MNICFVLFSFSDGGIGRVTSIVANELNKKKDTNCYALGFTDADERSPFKTMFEVTYLYHENLSMKNAILKYHYIKKITKFIRKNEIDMVIGCGAMFYPATVIAAKLCRIKSICWDHVSPYAGSDYKFEKESREFGARCSNCNLLLTKEAKKIFDKRYSRKNNFQIYNPIDPDLYNRQPIYNSKSKKIISVGRLCYQKNFKRLIHIAVIVLREYPEWEWDIFGEGLEYGELDTLIKENGMEKQLHLCGNVPDLYNRYPDYRFIVMTSRYEGLPMTLLEAAANGLPMIAFDVLTGPKEIIEDGVNGFLCCHENDEEMVEKIEKLINDEELRQKMSIESKKTAEKFNVYKICNQWIELLDSLSN